MDRRRTSKCRICGVESYSVYFPPIPSKMGVSGNYPICVNCQQKLFLHYASIFGHKLGLFMTAATLNVPYIPEVIAALNDTEKSAGVWKSYVDALISKDLLEKNNKRQIFTDGVYDIQQAFDGQTATLSIDTSLLSDPDMLVGREAVIQLFGTGPVEEPYTADELDLLAKHYLALTDGRPYLTEQTDLAIQGICKMEVLKERYLHKGEISKAKSLGDMIKVEKEGEQLRKKDELPNDTVRLDDIVMAVERAGLHINDYDELCKELARWSFHEPYPYTRDAADQMLLLIRNATAWNEGISEVSKLEAEYAIIDDKGEFAQTADKPQKRIYKDLDLLPLNMGADANAK